MQDRTFHRLALPAARLAGAGLFDGGIATCDHMMVLALTRLRASGVPDKHSAVAA